MTVGLDPIERLIQTLQKLAPSKSSIKASTFNGEEVKLFLEPFRDIATANGWDDREALLHLRSNLQGAACTYGRGQSRQEIE